MSWKAQINDRGVISRYKDMDTGEVVSAKEYARRMQMQAGGYSTVPASPTLVSGQNGYAPPQGYSQPLGTYMTPAASPDGGSAAGGDMGAPQDGLGAGSGFGAPPPAGPSPLIQQGAQILGPGGSPSAPGDPQQIASQDGSMQPPAHLMLGPGRGVTPTAGQPIQGKNLRLEGQPSHPLSTLGGAAGYKAHGFLDATSIAILLPTLVLLALIIAAAHKKRLFPWQTIRTFNPPSGLMTPRDYERSFLCPPNLRRHGRLGKRNPNATWTDADGVVVPFGFMARTHLPITIPIGRLPNKNMFIVAPSGSGKTTLMRAIIKALLAKPCVVIALEAKANDPNLDEKREGFKYSVLPEAQHAGFETLYFNPLDRESIHWNPLDQAPVIFASSIVQDVNSLPPEEQHWAERDHGYIAGLAQLLKWGAVQVSGEDENGVANRFEALGCNPRGLMRLVNNRRNIVESLRKLKSDPNVPSAELTELTQTLSSIIRTDTDWDKNIQGVRGRLRMFKNTNVLDVTERSNVDLRASMHKPTVLIFGAPASLGPDAESLASCFVYQLQQALHTRYGTASVLPLFAFFDEYQTLNMDIAGRLSAIVRGANGGLAIILQNISQISETNSSGVAKSGSSELKTIFSNSAIRVCLHNADETTAKFFSEEIGKHAVVVPGVSDHYQATGFGIFPTSWNRIHSQQVIARVDPDSIKRMEKHHALVYLSPAGDQEFGENKPLMVDLRGIEEIARLHLLHNVSSRRTPPGVAPPGTMPVPMPGVPGMPMPGSGGNSGGNSGGFPYPGSPQPGFAGEAIGQIGQTAAVAAAGALGGAMVTRAISGPVSSGERNCSKCGHAAGSRKFCIQCGNFVGPPATAQPQLETSAVMLNQGAPAPQQYGQPAGQSMPAQQVAPVGAGVSPNPSAPPFPSFAKPGASAANLTQASQIADAAQQTYGKRQPMTSLNPDPNRIGMPGQGQRPSGPVEF
jgi:hypothetical protein